MCYSFPELLTLLVSFVVLLDSSLRTAETLLLKAAYSVAELRFAFHCLTAYSFAFPMAAAV